MKIISYLLTFIILLNSTPYVFASEEQNTEKLITRLQNLTTNFNKSCVDSKVKNVESYFKTNGLSEVCWKLLTEINHLETQLSSLHPQLQNTVNCSTENCLNNKTPIISLPTLPLEEELSCTSADKQRILKECPGDLACNLASTLTTIPGVSRSIINPEKLLPKGLSMKSCSAGDSCSTQLITAFYDSILNFFSSAWDLLKMAGGFAKDQIVDFWKWVSDAEDSSSASQLALAKASEDEGLFRMLKDDFGGTISKIWQGLISSIKVWLKDDILCERWSGTPHRSQCLTPAKGFDCISCKSMVNGLCAITGVFASEILPAFITGGLTSAAKHGAGVTTRFLKNTFKVSDQAIKTIKNSKTLKSSLGLLSKAQKVTKASVVLSKVNQYFLSPARKIAKISFQVLSVIVRNSKAYMAETAKGKYIVFAQDSFKMAGKVVLYPIENNMTITAFKAGHQTFDKALKLAAPSLTNKTPVALIVTSHTPALDEVLTKIEIGHIKKNKTLSLELEHIKILEGKRKVLTQKALGAKKPSFSEIIRTIYPELNYGELAKHVSAKSILTQEKELYLHFSKIRNPELQKEMLNKYQRFIVESKQRKAILKGEPSYKEIVDNSKLSFVTRGARGVQLLGKLPLNIQDRKKLEAGIRSASLTAQNMKKTILINAGFTESEADKLIKFGFVGIPPN